ncbi:unnamed protein product [Pylaiella littoralis]
MGFAGEDFPRAYFTSLVGRTVDVEETRRLRAEMDTAADNARANSPAKAGGGGKGKGKEGKSPHTVNRWQQQQQQQQQGANGVAGAAAPIAGGERGEGGAGGENGDARGGDETVYRWHVDSLVGGGGGGGAGNEMEVVPLIKEGVVTDWDLMEKVWEHAAETRLKTKLSDHPVLISEKPFTSSKDRMKYTEIMFEKFGVSAEFMSKDAVLACFSIGRTTASLVDVGGDTTVVTPVYDGWVESKGIVKSLLGSNALQRYYLELLEQGGVSVPPLPTAMMKAPGNLRPSLSERLRMDVARDMMTLAGRTSDSPFEADAPQFSTIPTVPFRLPDGTEVGIGTDRFRVPELLVNTSPLTDALSGGGGGAQPPSPGLRALAESLARPGFVICPLQQAVVDSVLACDREQQAQMLNGVVLAGGGCCFEGLAERVKAEIDQNLDAPATGWRVKVLAAGNSERKVSTWLGGSILASLGSFHEMWLSKAEYEEHGAQMIDKKCP